MPFQNLNKVKLKDKGKLRMYIMNWKHKMPVEEINKKIIEMKRDNKRKKITQNEDRKYNRKYEHRRIELQRK